MDIFKTLSIALEADDITKEVSSEMEGLQDNEDDVNEGIGKTDNIFGTKDDDDDEGSPTSSDNDNEDTGDDESPDTGEYTIDEPTDDLEGMNEQDIEVVRKTRLRENMILLHNIISSNIKLLSEYTPEDTSRESVQILYNITANLTDCKNILAKEITESFHTKSYASLLKTYISINRVYELCQNSLEKYFDNVNILNQSSSKKNGKQKL